MSSTPADTLVPLGVAFICAIGLTAAGQLPSYSPLSTSPERINTVTTPASGPAQTGRLLPHLRWQAQPDAGQPLTRIGFGSCLRQKKPQPIWNAVIAAKPQTFLMMGDNVYGDFKSADGAKLASAYKALAAHGDFTKARDAMPMLATWDDHDYGSNDGGAEFEHKVIATRLFNEFWQGSGSLEGNRGPGVAYARAFGPVGRRVQIILLDTRSFRSPLTRRPKDAPGKGKYQPDTSAGKTMLGDTQWQWLEARLREPADLRLIVSSIQVLADGHAWERWGNLPNERDKLYRMIDTTGARGVIFLSGDRHRAAVYRMNRKGKAPLIEVTSSALNASFRDPTEKGPHQLITMIGRNNFGMAVIDWQARYVTLSLRTEDGIAASALTVPFTNPSSG